MKHDLQFAPPLPETTPAVVMMKHSTALQLDPAPLADIYAHKGEVAASETVCRALEDMADRLNKLVLSHGRADVAQLIRPAGRIAAIADQVGLIEVACAARGVACSAEQNDEVALDATLARLERSFDLAISQVWSFKDLI